MNNPNPRLSSTASYRLHPTIDFKEPVTGNQAKKLQACFPPGVIEIQDNQAIVGPNLRNDLVSREVYRHEDLKNKIQLGRLKNHFIFNIESTGALPAKDLFVMATEILEEKCRLYENELSASGAVLHNQEDLAESMTPSVNVFSSAGKKVGSLDSDDSMSE